MKKLLLAFGLLLAVGGGCLQVGKIGGNKTVEGDWFLAFDLPEGWVMTVPYQEPTSDMVTPNQTIDRSRSEIFVQSTDKAILSGGVGADESVPADSYVTQDWTQIRVTRLDPRRRIPSEAEDIGEGFSRVKLCEDGEDCEIYGRHNYDYYLATGDASYQFKIWGNDVGQAEQIIRSAEVVTIPEESSAE